MRCLSLHPPLPVWASLISYSHLKPRGQRGDRTLKGIELERDIEEWGKGGWGVRGKEACDVCRYILPCLSGLL